MLSVHLHNVKFHAYHGLYEEEKLIGNDFIVDAIVSYQTDKKIITNIENTINYATVYELIKERMQQPSDLLETIATDISHQIMHQFSIVQEIFISIKKLNPPITGFQGNVGISFTLKRNNV